MIIFGERIKCLSFNINVGICSRDDKYEEISVDDVWKDFDVIKGYGDNKW